MAHSKTKFAALAIGITAFVAAPSVFAQAKTPGGGGSGVKTTTTAGGGNGDSDSGYGYTFDDDPLNAGGFGPNDATIRVRPKAARATLIRPRTSFVPEMLKSVENL